MVEKDTIFSSKIKSKGIFSFKDFYQFMYDWQTSELELELAEEKYVEKLSGDTKEIVIEWKGKRKVTDYFQFEIKTKYRITQLKNIEITQNGKKIKTNEGDAEIAVKGTLIRDYKGKFETNALNKFLRSIYEKWVISSRIDQFEEKLIGNCDEILSQAKAYLDLEGKR